MISMFTQNKSGSFYCHFLFTYYNSLFSNQMA